MSVTNYTDLKASVAEWLARDDLTAAIPTWITLFEAKANRTLRCRQMERRSYADIDSTIGEPQFISLPGDYLEMRSLTIASLTEKPRLDFLDDDKIKDYRGNVGHSTGVPRCFGVFGYELELVPKPDQNYRLEMVYRATIPALSNDNLTNWLITLAPDAYLYGALMESAPYIKEDSRLQVWSAGLSAAFDAINGVSASAKAPEPLRA